MLTRFEQKEVFVISSNQNFHRYVRDNLPDGDFFKCFLLCQLL